MPRAPPAGFFLISAVALFMWFVVYTRDHARPIDAISHADRFKFNKPHNAPTQVETALPEVNTGDAIMSKLGNETLKEELGRAAWKLFHTTMARFPDKPTTEESKALKDYIHLFARLYPCGECATHFQQIIKKYPPQTSTRSSAAAWACFVHNEVNISKDKPIFDCANIGDWYDCGCADEEKESITKAGEHSEKIANGASPVKIEKEGLTKGG